MAAFAALVAGLVKGKETADRDDPQARILLFSAGGETLLRVDLGSATQPASIRRAIASASPRSVRRALLVEKGTAAIRYRLDVQEAVTAASSVDARGGVAEVRAKPISARIQAPVVAQRLRNNCEAAALQILLATRGINADQLELQRQLPRSGPLDPIDRDGARVWGDPELGYVGRPDGGGTAGGFGVYQDPVKEVGAQHGAAVRDISGGTVGSVRTELLAGRAVMVWVGLADGPYGQWRSPEGKAVEVNFNEHTMVLSGVRRNGAFEVVNPLKGTRETWSESRFASAWALLGRRALVL